MPMRAPPKPPASQVWSGKRRMPSDHFDGRRFFNPTLKPDFAPSLPMLSRMLREPRNGWPRTIENTGVPRLHGPLERDEIAITFVGHATFLIQFDGLAILTDPVWSNRAGPFNLTGPRRVREPGVAFEALPNIDLVLLSHNHYDHLDKATLKALRHAFDPAICFAAGDMRLIRPFGFRDMRELDWWDEAHFDSGLKITFTPAQHSSARGLHDRHRSLWGGAMIESRGRRIYFCGDSGYAPHFTDIRARLGAPDIALIPIGAYEPRWFMTPIHMNPSEAVQAHRDLESRQSIGMHHGTFQLTTEAIHQPVIDLKAALAEHGVDERAFVTQPEGETVVYRVP
jgi:L-ascorbate metabolism protein UlaG (beta-lactamase superfamily)